MVLNIDRLKAEGLVPLAEAAAGLPGRGTGQLDSSTMTRWCGVGLLTSDGNRVRLEHVRVGSRLYTSKAALTRFLTAMTLGGLANATPSDLLLPTTQELANVG